MTSNFFLNNLFTYRDRRLRGLALLRGLFTFYAICALGTVANVGIAGYIFSRNEIWWLAGVAGVVVVRSGTTPSLQSSRGNKNKNRK
jgi:dolichol-phosphate mannosyltransferase